MFDGSHRTIKHLHFIASPITFYYYNIVKILWLKGKPWRNVFLIWKSTRSEISHFCRNNQKCQFTLIWLRMSLSLKNLRRSRTVWVHNDRSNNFQQTASGKSFKHLNVTFKIKNFISNNWKGIFKYRLLIFW